jgi:hypothetical protein
MIGMNIDAPTTRGDEATKPVSKRAEVAIKNTAILCHTLGSVSAVLC